MEEGYVQLQEPDVKYFVNYCLLGGVKIRRMDLDLKDPFWPGYCNPSIMYDKKDDNWKFIIRNVNYVLHGSQHPYKCYSSWGPVLYSVPWEDGRNLKTQNFLGTANDPMNDDWHFTKIETRPYTPIWEFWGEEDARLVRWNDKLYTTGVRRDDNKDGRGRMELMHITENATKPQEINRLKVKAPGKDDGYCEKNWMPIRDLPYHYVRLANPTIVVKVDPKTGKSEEVVHKDKASGFVDEKFDLLRGSSQVVTWGDYYISLVHTCELWLTASNRKFARYCHVFIVWDKEWNIVKMSPLFSFGNYNVEFTTGLEYKDGKFYIPFALQDNFSFLMEVDENVIRNFIDGKLIEKADTTSMRHEILNQTLFKDIFNPNATQQELFNIGKQYFDEQNLAAAYCVFTHSADTFDYTYTERLYAARSIADLGHRDRHEISMWISCIQHDPNRPEAYMAAAMYYFYRDSWYEALFFAEEGMKRLEPFLRAGGKMIMYDEQGYRLLYNKCLFETQRYVEAIPALDASNVEHQKNRRVL